MAVRLPRLNAGEVDHILLKHGFVSVSQRGSHQKWRNFETGRLTIVPYHQEKDLPAGTLKSIINGSGIPEEEFLDP